MSWARASLFNLAFLLWTAIAGTLGLPVLLMPRRIAMGFGRLWAGGALFLLRAIVGLDHQIRGQIPRSPASSR